MTLSVVFSMVFDQAVAVLHSSFITSMTPWNPLSLTNNLDFESIYLDSAKAFDKVDHKLLMKKLQLYGIHPKLINWIRSFLTNRMQGVVVNGQISFLALIISGVPQGTVLGPILFLIFINDIAHCLSDSIIGCFADDTRVSKAIGCEEDVSTLQCDLIKGIQWSDNNNMSIVPTQRQA